MRKIKQAQRTNGKYTLNKNKRRENYIITSEDIKEMAMQQEGNKILDVLDGLTEIVRGKEPVQIER